MSANNQWTEMEVKWDLLKKDEIAGMDVSHGKKNGDKCTIDTSVLKCTRKANWEIKKSELENASDKRATMGN